MRASQDYLSEQHIIGADKREQLLKFASDLTSLTQDTQKVVDDLKKIKSNGERN